jgi:triosephosphate isomerase
VIIASNFKTNHTRESTKEFVQTVSDFVDLQDIKDEVLIFPSAPSLDAFVLPSNVSIGAQNAYPVKSGSFTGEIGSQQLDEFGVKMLLIGHSERRHILKESNALIEQKYNFYKELGYKIVFCIGEPLEVREKGIQEVIDYNLAQLENIDLGYEHLIIAYEPVWAIGTGVSATKQQIEQTHQILRQSIKAPLLYGGSVKVANLKEILSIPNVDGVLVGTASWNVEEFQKMIAIAKEMK